MLRTGHSVPPFHSNHTVPTIMFHSKHCVPTLPHLQLVRAHVLVQRHDQPLLQRGHVIRLAAVPAVPPVLLRPPAAAAAAAAAARPRALRPPLPAVRHELRVPAQVEVAAVVAEAAGCARVCKAGCGGSSTWGNRLVLAGC